MNAFERVIAHPRSVSARRKLAREWRACGDPRAELIERQLREHDGLGMLSWDTVPDEIADLIAQHGREWAGRIADLAISYFYELGLVACIGIKGDEFVEHASELVRLTPLVQVTLAPPIDLERIAALAPLSQLSILKVVAGPWLNDRAVAAFAASPYIRGLRGIGFRGGQIGHNGLSALKGSPHLKDIVYIDLSENPCATEIPEFNGSHHLTGPASTPYLNEAYASMALDYTGHMSGWPPTFAEITWEE